MEDFYTYILQVNIALVVFYLLYRLLFVRDTFLGIRRLFLFSVIFLAFVYPVVSLSSWLEQQPVLPAVVIGYAELVAITASPIPVESEAGIAWQEIVMWIWGSGMLILFGRMLFQLGCILSMRIKGRRVEWEGDGLIALAEETAPFSFFSWIFVNPEYHEEKDLQEIILHEKTHVRQLHSVDMLLSELLCILFWFNPAVWLLRKEIRQNLEFLADKQVVRSGCNRKNYQYHLLRLSHQSTAVPIVNNFNVSQLKKRIIMMNKKKTSRISLLKYALLLPVTALLILAGNAEVVAEIAHRAIPGNVAENNQRFIKGRVVDVKGEPLPGVTVILQNTSIGVVTNDNGEYSLALSDRKSGTLLFSYVGKMTESLPFDEKTKVLNAKMAGDNLQLDRVIVTGYRTEKPKLKEGEEVFVVVEEMPRFKEGNVQKFLARYVKYPVLAMEAGVEGTVYVSFIIDKTGKVTEPQIVRSPDLSLSEEALRVIRLMPDWEPGKQRGKTVDVRYTMPIEFKLANVEETTFRVTTKTNVIGADSVKHTSKTMWFTDKTGKAKPLFIVDGIKTSEKEVKALVPDQINSVTVLKEASAVAIYGKEGENGVVVIELKNADK